MDRVNTESSDIIEQRIVMQSRMERMEKEAIYELLHYHEKSTKQKLKDIVKKAAGRYVPPKDMIFWPTGLLANGLMERVAEGNTTKETNTVVEALTAHADQWINAGMQIYHVDDVLCGETLLDLYKLTKEEKYKTGADKLAEYLLQIEKLYGDAVGSIPYRPAQANGHIYVDGIGMMCPFLVKYGINFGNERAVEIALKQIENMLKYGMDGETGLPYHGFQYENKVKYGIIGWGRAVGWLMLGMAGVIRQLSDEAEKTWQMQDTEEAFWHLTESVAPYQKSNGAFCWQLTAMEGPEDSSATAMIAWALQQALNTRSKSQLQTMSKQQAVGRKILQSAIEYLATCEQEGKIYQCSGECLGFSQYPQVYSAYPWSLGPAYAVLCKNKL